MLPKGLAVDTCNGAAYISFVAFTVSDLSFKTIPLPPYFSSFKEINLRTYVIKDGIRGIYMFSLEADKWPIAALSHLLLGIPYKTSRIHIAQQKLESSNKELQFSAELYFREGDALAQKSEIDHWLTERHCLYQESGAKLFRFDIHHREWPLSRLETKIKDLQYHKQNFNTLGHPPVLQHFSKHIKVLFWGRREV
jgi:uncharacterized protein YqjF (DUF2071 family)